MAKLTTEITIEELQYRIHAHENDLTQMWTADYFLNVQKELLALKQAAKNPVAWVATDSEGFPEYNGHNEFSAGCGVGTPLYAVPVLPKQPESVAFEIIKEAWRLMDGQDPKTADWHFAASAYINAYHDTMPAQPAPENKNAQIKRQKALAWLKRVAYENPCMKEVKTCIEVLSAPAQPALVEKLKKVMNSWLAMEHKLAFQPEFTDVMMLLDAEAAHAQPVIPDEIIPDQNNSYEYVDGWNAYRAAMLKAQQNEPQNIPENIPAQPVSEPYKLPSGYALVPCKLTAENGAKSCMIGEFTEQTEISCPECFGDDECETCDGSGMIEVTVPVSWTTIKDIWAKGIEHFAAAAAQESE